MSLSCRVKWSRWTPHAEFDWSEPDEREGEQAADEDLRSVIVCFGDETAMRAPCVIDESEIRTFHEPSHPGIKSRCQLRLMKNNEGHRDCQ